MNDRNKKIIEELEKNGTEGIKNMNLTPQEIDDLVDKIDNKIAVLNMEETLEVSKLLGYNLPIDYCTFYSKQLTTHIKPNLFKVNGKEKIIRYLYTMDKNSKTYIAKFINFDSQYSGQIVPFAELEFGDTLCFDKSTNNIVYYNHEEDSIIKLADSWDDFSKQLYSEE